MEAEEDENEEGCVEGEVDHHERGMTRILGMAASKAGDPERMSDDCTQSDGMVCDRAEWRWWREEGRDGGLVGVGLT